MELVSFEELMADERLNPEHATGFKLDQRDINDYAMVVIDEAHNLRNPATQRAQALRRLLAGSPPKQLVMLTATPVNNSLWDLYHLLGYFLRNDAEFADSGIASLRDHFANAVRLNPDDLTPEHLFDVLDAVAVRRTRSFVKRFYPNDTVAHRAVAETPSLPDTEVRRSAHLDAVLPVLRPLRRSPRPDCRRRAGNERRNAARTRRHWTPRWPVRAVAYRVGHASTLTSCSSPPAALGPAQALRSSPSLR